MGEYALPDALIGLMSVVAFAAFAVDKALARMYMPRIADKHLHLLTALGGFPGSFLAMVVFRHKTRKLLFWTVLLFAAVLWSTLHPFWLDTVGRWLLQAAGLPERPWKAATVLTTLLLHQALGQGPIFLLSLSTVVASVALL